MLHIQFIEYKWYDHRWVSNIYFSDDFISKWIFKMWLNCRAAPDIHDKTIKHQPSSDWKMDRGYPEKPNVELYPYRVFGTGPHSSLMVVLKLYKSDISYLCSGAVQGFKITFQSPHEQPQLWNNYFYISPGTASAFKIYPNLVFTLPNVQRYSPNIKHCFFNSERQLRFFKEYTQVFFYFYFFIEFAHWFFVPFIQLN